MKVERISNNAPQAYKIKKYNNTTPFCGFCVPNKNKGRKISDYIFELFFSSKKSQLDHLDIMLRKNQHLEMQNTNNNNLIDELEAQITALKSRLRNNNEQRLCSRHHKSIPDIKHEVKNLTHTAKSYLYDAQDYQMTVHSTVKNIFKEHGFVFNLKSDDELIRQFHSLPENKMVKSKNSPEISLVFHSPEYNTDGAALQKITYIDNNPASKIKQANIDLYPHSFANIEQIETKDKKLIKFDNKNEFGNLVKEYCCFIEDKNPKNKISNTQISFNHNFMITGITQTAENFRNQNFERVIQFRNGQPIKLKETLHKTVTDDLEINL